MRTACVEIERALLGSVLLDNSSMVEYMSLNGSDFSDQRNEIIYNAMYKMFSKSMQIDYLTLENYLCNTTELVAAGGVSYITGLTDGVMRVCPTKHYVQAVKEASAARKIKENFMSLYSMVDTSDSFEDIFSKSYKGLDGIYEHIQLSDTDFNTEAYERLEKIQSGNYIGHMSTGITMLDKYSPAPDEFCIIGARPSTGKTALAVAIIENMVRAGKNVLFFSIEMGGVSVIWRRWSMLSGVPFWKMRYKNTLTQEEWERITRAADVCKSRNYRIITNKNNIYEIEAEIRRSNKIKHVDAAFIDHLHLMRHPKADRHDLGIKQSLDSLARLTKTEESCIFLLAQLNRGIESRGEDSQPRMSDLRDSGAAEEDADVIWFMHRPDRMEDNPKKEVQLITAKNRNGPTGKVIVEYDYETGRFG